MILFKHDVASEQILIEAQKHGQDKGFTDIEILIRDVCHIIFEAKRYWELPSTAQLEKYAARLETNHVSKPLIVSLSTASREYSKRRLPRTIGNIPLEHRSWADIYALVQQAYSNTRSRKEKLWLREFEIHLRGYVSVRNQQDNRVLVVALSEEPIREGNSYRWIDAVEKDNSYFHPIGSPPWPAEPPNYIAFRYEGQLQSVHYVKSYREVADPSTVNENWKSTDSYQFVYELGPAMRPPVTVRTGFRGNGHRLCIIDTLLSGVYETIRDAHKETKRRLNENNY